MSYELSLKDKRVRARITKVLKFLKPILKSQTNHTAVKMSRDKLLKIFGKQNNPLSSYLRSELLIVASDEYVPGLMSMSYFVNKKNFLKLESELNDYLNGIVSFESNNSVNKNTIIMCATSGFSPVMTHSTTDHPKARILPETAMNLV